MSKTLQQISANIQLRLLNMENKIPPLHPTIKNIATSYYKFPIKSCLYKNQVVPK
jgi:hypothetical protein